MSLISVSVQIPEELWRLVQEAAAAQDATSDDVVYTALESYLAEDKATETAIAEGFRQLDAGNFIEHEDVLRWFERKKRGASEAA